MATNTVRAFLIYQGISNRSLLETSPVELPDQGLLFLHESETMRLFGERYRGQVITGWRYAFERVAQSDPRYRAFYQYSLTLDRPLLRLMQL
jgi:hypothetical protein